MPDQTVVLDSNLLVLLIVGATSPAYIGTHKRLRAYKWADYMLLDQLLAGATRIVVTPNTLTETLNLAGQIAEPTRGNIFRTFRLLLGRSVEVYVASRQAAERSEFLRLGLTDSVVLASANDQSIIVTADLNLYLEAMRQGRNVINFNHRREANL